MGCVAPSCWASRAPPGLRRLIFTLTLTPSLALALGRTLTLALALTLALTRTLTLTARLESPQPLCCLTLDAPGASAAEVHTLHSNRTSTLYPTLYPHPSP